ncbi:Putative carbonic anhydrase-like protein 1 [Eumeta japonica]|uniref:Carbonic anhydrase-like protein 1 n=1 Tax=Eumeta variegata TaxID=151549 RepID=A0A4C1YZ96_EUMVA|nr:Putative carbonic anhydrase-like protein 1 [Eumeta japonica]
MSLIESFPVCHRTSVTSESDINFTSRTTRRRMSRTVIAGPAFWGLINPEWSLCNKGRRQSPVNLEPEKLLFDPNLRSLHIDKHRINGLLSNTGHSVIFTVENETRHHINITGGPLSYKYQFHEIHIHYGLHDQFGSEHAINGYSFPAEMFLHALELAPARTAAPRQIPSVISRRRATGSAPAGRRSSAHLCGGSSRKSRRELRVYPRFGLFKLDSVIDFLQRPHVLLFQIQIFGFNSQLYSNFSEALHKAQGVVSISLLLQLGDLSNPELRILTEELENIKYGGAEMPVNKLSVCGLLPDTAYYMTYDGSTTAPACFETVTWVIINKPIYITKQQRRATSAIQKLGPRCLLAPAQAAECPSVVLPFPMNTRAAEAAVITFSLAHATINNSRPFASRQRLRRE